MIFIRRSTLLFIFSLALLIISGLLLYSSDTVRSYAFSLAILIVGCSIMVMVFIEDVLRTIFEENATIVELALPNEDLPKEDNEDNSKN